MVNTLNNKKNIKQYVLYSICITVLVLSIIIGYYKCPFSCLFGVPCPLCGMSRALISVVNLDFKQAFYYHALWPIVLIVIPVYFIIKKLNITISKKVANAVYIVIGILLLAYYIIRHCYSSPIVTIHFEDSLLYILIKKVLKFQVIFNLYIKCYVVITSKDVVIYSIR